MTEQELREFFENEMFKLLFGQNKVNAYDVIMEKVKEYTQSRLQAKKLQIKEVLVQVEDKFSTILHRCITEDCKINKETSCRFYNKRLDICDCTDILCREGLEELKILHEKPEVAQEKTFTRAEIAAMTFQEFEQNEKAIFAQLQRGLIK